eukprot:15324427-Ditylum_brightwellii.AAC.1
MIYIKTRGPQEYTPDWSALRISPMTLSAAGQPLLTNEILPAEKLLLVLPSLSFVAIGWTADKLGENESFNGPDKLDCSHNPWHDFREH